MNGPDQLPLFGFVNPSARLPGFLVPVFGGSDQLWIQDSKGDNLVLRFCAYENPDERVERVESKFVTEVGRPLLYAFQFPNESVAWGTKSEIQELLNRKLDLLGDFPFLRIDVLKFIDKVGALPDAINQAKQKLARSNPRIAEQWAQLMGNFDHGPTQSTKKWPLFNVGDLVSLRSDPNVILPVIEVVPDSAEVRYRVFRDNKVMTYFESQLTTPATDGLTLDVITATELQSLLTSIQILSPSTTTLFSLRSGRVNFVPYQYRPVLKLIRSDRPRILVADEVGVGKTIEAGLIVKELRARMDLKSVLIICPKALVAERKWFNEMKRFDESFMELDGPRLRHCLRETDLDGEWPRDYAKAILPFSLFNEEVLFGNPNRPNQRKGFLQLDPPPKFDLVIVDEAHNIRNPETLLHQGVRFFCDHAEAVVFLSATPVQLGSEDLYTLLNVLRPDLVIDKASFQQMAEPNEHINTAIQHCRSLLPTWQEDARSSLNDALTTEWGRTFFSNSPSFLNVYNLLQAGTTPDSDRVALIRQLEELYTFSSLINRTRRRDIGEFTTRKPETVTIDFTPGQKALHDGLLELIARILAFAHGQQNVKFMMTTIRRQASSCLFGLAPMLEGILSRKLDSLELMEASESEAEADFSFIDDVRADIQKIVTAAKQLDPYDPKAESFIKVITDKAKLPNNKTLVFSTFRHTLTYLTRCTQNSKLRFGLVHGDVPDDERADLRRRFALSSDVPEAIDVLLSSEVGCEGLDFQFCDFLINYDLPWNPMRIEQRIGRIDRYGQKSPTVAIVNFITPGTVDADIYDRCLMRIGVFQHAIGGNEEILGNITKQIRDIADAFDLSDTERQERLQQLADNSIRRLQEDQRLESSQAELFGLHVPNQTWQKEIEAAESYWLSPHALERCVRSYLTTRTNSSSDQLLGDKPLKTLRLNQEARAALLSDFKRLSASHEKVARDWERWLAGNQPVLAVTFEQAVASEDPKVVHLSVLHPLVRQAANFVQMSDAVRTKVRVQSSDLAPGTYPFALYRWRMHGVKQDEKLTPVALNGQLETILLDLLPSACDLDEGDIPFGTEQELLEKRHHSKWTVAQAIHSDANRAYVSHRVQSLNASHKARSKSIEDQIARTDNRKIRLMKESELARANADFNRRIEELQRAANSGDIHATAVVFGTITIERENAK